MKNRDEAFHEQLERLLTAMTCIDDFDKAEIHAALEELCKLFGVEKCVSSLFQNEFYERVGDGDVRIGYDSGEECVEVMRLRKMTGTMAVGVVQVFRKKGAPPYDKEEEERVMLLMKTVLSFMARNRLQEVVEKLTYHDDNGFRNMRCYTRYLVTEGRSGSMSGKAAMQYNLLHFSLVNQQVGRAAGDLVMRNHYEGLSELIGEQGIVCRMGGDNFLAVCDQSQLDVVLDYLAETPVVYEPETQQRVLVSASVGVTRLPENFVLDTPGDVLDKIIPAIQVARSAGKAHIVFFDEQLHARRERAMRIQQVFPEALRHEEFKVFYQPKIDVITGELSGAEALCRWFRGGQMISPAEFIPVLEQTTDICKLDFYMLDSVCADIRRWLDEGRKVVRVSVNLSRKHMLDVDLLEHIIEIIDRHQVPHEFIEIELTETTTDVAFRDLKRVVNGLQQVGIYTAVDDFGMGYSSLNLIREIPWNVLKVDRSFLPVEGDLDSSTRSVMFKYVVAMAKEMGLECIAEGVETPYQFGVLRNNHCDQAQGFLFDRPLPVEEFEKRLQQHRYALDPES